MRHRQGQRLPKQRIATIQRLLANTDMTINEIVERMGDSKAVVSSINRKFEIRMYRGRSQWVVNKDWNSAARKYRSGKPVNPM
jgi:hypothetical protein